MDKYSILLIKKENITDTLKIKKVEDEIKYLINYINTLNEKYNLAELFSKLLDINKKLWTIEDDIRIKEKNQDFDDEFIQLARLVYFTNDERASVKNEINVKTESNIFEVKSYEKYA